MKNTRRVLIMACSLMMLLALILPAGALEQVFASMEAEPLHQAAQITAQPAPQAKAAKKQPTKEEIAAQWATVTSSSTTYAEVPSVTAPYAAGSLTDAFLETGVTYLNYVRFVAGLPAVTLDPTLNADSQHGAVLLAAINELTHYPSQPKDMEDAFYQRGSAATQSANISARWGYRDQTTMLKSAVEGCMNDNNSLGNLSTAGHRRWFLNPTLGKVGFGYAQSVEKWSYIVTKVFDRSGAGCDFDFISWPAEGNHPTNLFNAKDPWTVTLNTSVYKTASVKALQVTITRESDGKQWVLDASTGSPNLDSEDNIKPYLTVENSYYGLPNCIIFHPGSDAVAKYEGIYTVKITGLVTSKGKAAELNYTVDFFDINSVSCAHTYSYTVTKAPTVAESGLLTGSCSKCSGTTTVTLPKLNTTDYSYTVTKAATCTADGTGRYTWKTTTYGSFSFDVIISKACHKIGRAHV